MLLSWGMVSPRDLYWVQYFLCCIPPLCLMLCHAILSHVSYAYDTQLHQPAPLTELCGLLTQTYFFSSWIIFCFFNIYASIWFCECTSVSFVNSVLSANQIELSIVQQRTQPLQFCRIVIGDLFYYVLYISVCVIKFCWIFLD